MKYALIIASILLTSCASSAPSEGGRESLFKGYPEPSYGKAWRSKNCPDCDGNGPVGPTVGKRK